MAFIFNMEEENKEINLPSYKPRKPWVAFFLSLITSGLGFLYLGKPKKAALFYFPLKVLFITVIFIVIVLHPDGISFIIYIILGGFIQIILVPLLSFKDAKKVSKEYELKKYNRWYIYIIILLIDYYLLGNLSGINIHAYRMTPTSMENTILAGDRLIVDESAYKPWSGLKGLLSNNSAIPVHGDIVAFYVNSNPDIFNPSPLLKTAYLMRCIALESDTIQIINKVVYVNKKISPIPITVKFFLRTLPKNEPEPGIFPKGYKWNEDNYGPLIVPKVGMEIRIDSANLESWRVFILRENSELDQIQSIKLINDILQTGCYIVKDDYLFMMGDNRDNSLDSRFIGFINTKDVIGKALFICYSSNPEDGILWNRIGLNVK
jgi:signal peptidase I